MSFPAECHSGFQVQKECRARLVGAPVEVYGTIPPFCEGTGGSGGLIDGVLYDGCGRVEHIDWSDPRLDGTVTISQEKDQYQDSGSLTIWSVDIRIENDQGAWQMRPYIAIGRPSVQEASATWIFWGEGAYSNLEAWVTVDGPLFDGTSHGMAGYVISRAEPNPDSATPSP